MGRLRAFVTLADATDAEMVLRRVRLDLRGRWTEIDGMGPLRAMDRGPVRVAAGYDGPDEFASMSVGFGDESYIVWFTRNVPVTVLVAAVRAAVEEIER